MKKLSITIATLLLLIATTLTAQEKDTKTVRTYYRNALTQMMVYHGEDEFGYDVYEIFKQLPPLEKYDNHDLGLYVIDNAEIKGVRSSNGLYRQVYGGSMILTSDEKQANANGLLKLLNQAEIGKRMVAKWFNLTGETLQDAHFGTELLQERSNYNATMLDVEKARYTVEGMAALQDVSDELISHSFVLVSDLTYITAEDRADAAKTVFSILGGALDALSGGNAGERLAQDVGDIADAFTGFKVMTNTYLFQLVWNDSLANVFYEKYYTPVPNEEKIRAFLTDKSMFQLKFLGNESSNYEKTQRKGKYNRIELLELITARSIDKNVASLQGRFEDFRIKAPIVSVEYDKKGKPSGYRVQIGEKEGVTENATFEVLECKIEKGRMIYKKVGTMKAVKNQIWDNRFNAAMENDEDQEVTGTLFRLNGAASTEIVPGMLIRQTNG